MKEEKCKRWKVGLDSSGPARYNGMGEDNIAFGWREQKLKKISLTIGWLTRKLHSTYCSGKSRLCGKLAGFGFACSPNRKPAWPIQSSACGPCYKKFAVFTGRITVWQ